MTMYSDSIADARHWWCCSSSYISLSSVVIIVLIIISIVTTMITTKSPQGITIIYIYTPHTAPHRPTKRTSQLLTKSESRTGTFDRSDASHMPLKSLHPGKLTWNLKHSALETTFLLGKPIFRVNVFNIFEGSPFHGQFPWQLAK